MIDPSISLAELLQRDKRYAYEAYVFVFESLHFAQTQLGMGGERPREYSELDPEAIAAADAEAAEKAALEAEFESDPDSDESEVGHERHLTGQQLCEAIRCYALEQFGFMAKCVLNSWGIKSTSDFGEIVYNLIEIEQMRKTPNDRREHFDDVFDFDNDLQQGYKITLPD